MSVVAILTAAGSGTRLGFSVPKALVEIDGVPLVVLAARGLVGVAESDAPGGFVPERGAVDLLIVTAPGDRVADFRAALGEVVLGVPVLVVAGGVTRQASVSAALAALPPTATIVLVHDAARPLAPPSLVRRIVTAVAEGRDAVVPGVPVVDTIKRIGAQPVGSRGSGPAGAGSHGGASVEGAMVLATVRRDELRAVQTPQGFTVDVLRIAHANGAHLAFDDASAVSDDAGLVEAIGVPVWLVDGHEDAFKITSPRDLALAGLVLAERTERELPGARTNGGGPVTGATSTAGLP